LSLEAKYTLYNVPVSPHNAFCSWALCLVKLSIRSILSCSWFCQNQISRNFNACVCLNLKVRLGTCDFYASQDFLNSLLQWSSGLWALSQLTWFFDSEN
jgi:hypothetical protein